MRSRYSPLPDDSAVFRTIGTGGVFLPAGHELPLPEWLEPTSGDISEARLSGRPAGVSVWDQSMTSFRQACVWRGAAEDRERHFVAHVSRIRRVGAEHQRPLDVVADPLDTASPEYAAIVNESPPHSRASQEKSALGHALIEGIKRPAGVTKGAHRAFRDALVREFRTP